MVSPGRERRGLQAILPAIVVVLLGTRALVGQDQEKPEEAAQDAGSLDPRSEIRNPESEVREIEAAIRKELEDIEFRLQRLKDRLRKLSPEGESRRPRPSARPPVDLGETLLPPEQLRYSELLNRQKELLGRWRRRSEVEQPGRPGRHRGRLHHRNPVPVAGCEPGRFDLPRNAETARVG